MFCENCGNKLNEGAAFCPNCGTKAVISASVASVDSNKSIQETIKENVAKEKEKLDKHDRFRPVVKSQEDTVTETATKEEPPTKELTEEKSLNEETITEESVNAEILKDDQAKANAVEDVNQQALKEKKAKKEKKEKVKKEKKAKVWLIVAAAILGVVLVISLVVAINYKTINNFIKKKTLSPDDYAQYVLKENMHDSASAIASLYENLMLNAELSDTYTITENIDVEVSDAGMELLEDATDEDFYKAFEDMDLSIIASHKEDLMSVKYDVSLKGENILDVELIFDKNAEKVYIGVPGARDEYMSIPLDKFYSDSEISNLYDDLDKMAAIGQVSISKEQLERMLIKYQDVLIENVEGVKISDEDVTIEGVSQKLTAVKFTVDMELMVDALIDTIDVALTDEDLKDYYINYATALDVDDPEDSYEEDFIYELEDLREEIEDTDFDRDEELKFVVYVNNKGEVTCTKIDYETERYDWRRGKRVDVTYTIFNGYVVDGNRFGYELSYDDGDEEFSVTGSGTMRALKFTGDFEVLYGRAEIKFSVKDLDLSKLDKGLFSGELRVELSQFTKYGLPRKLKKTDLLVGYELTKNGASISVKLLDNDGNVLVNLSTKTLITNTASITIPKDTVNIKKIGDIDKYLKDADFDKFYDELDSTGSDDVYDILEEGLYQIVRIRQISVPRIDRLVIYGCGGSAYYSFYDNFIR